MKRVLLIIIVCLMAITSVLAQSSIKKQTIAYSVKDTIHLRLDKYVDNSVPYQGKRPVLVYVHGGGFATGSRINALQIKYLKHFTAQGFVAISIDYRLGLANNKQPDQETIMKAVSLGYGDLIDATAFILSKANEWNIDTSKIIISGGSAGAIACLTAEYDICSNGEFSARLPKGFNYAGVISQAGNVIIHQDTLTWKRQPCPMLLMHGSKDQLVTFNSASFEGNLYAGSNYIHNQLVKLNYPHWLYEEQGADHIVALKPLQYNFGEIDTFIDKFVMKGYQSIVHTVWADFKPDSMQDMMKVVPLYIQGWDKTDVEIK
ncbi:alpha/beta hydrolase [Mucilaginibacter sp. cycad4]|uniref:alpha/beta hydrolase n=1 Tax=Mucilaginibacter sp. cycad4 TaxID=3342096 RepID=UPI002AAC03A5|nr:alpha/beta hydrolase [Mucilaginibacter gossypii]WPV02007.1 alpha/beta hydrolase [Mucilaginibacter gossypii]